MANNSYKNPTPVPTPEPPQWLTKIIDFILKDEKFQLSIGLFFILTSFALFFAFFSYLFTGKADQSVVETALSASVQDNGREVTNWLGMTGAVLAHIFIFKWFGLGAFLLVPITFLLGWRLAFKTELFSTTQTLQISAFAVAWTSILLGALFSHNPDFGFLVGGLGFAITETLRGLIGTAGTMLVVLFGLLVFMVYYVQVSAKFTVDGDVTQKAKNLFQSLKFKFSLIKNPFSNANMQENDEESEGKEFTPKKPNKDFGKTTISTPNFNTNPNPKFTKTNPEITLEINADNNKNSDFSKTIPPKDGRKRPDKVENEGYNENQDEFGENPPKKNTVTNFLNNLSTNLGGIFGKKPPKETENEDFEDEFEKNDENTKNNHQNTPNNLKNTQEKQKNPNQNLTQNLHIHQKPDKLENPEKNPSTLLHNEEKPSKIHPKLPLDFDKNTATDKQEDFFTPEEKNNAQNNVKNKNSGFFSDENDDKNNKNEKEEDLFNKKNTMSYAGLYDPTLVPEGYQKPYPELLNEPPVIKRQVSSEELEANKDKIVETLSNYGIGISQIRATIGPTVTLYEIIPEAGVRISKIKNLEDDIALSLSALGIRIIAPIPGKGTIGIEVPNKKREMVAMKTIFETDVFKNTDKALPVVLGKSITGEVIVADLAKMPHLLMAGATGQGKSVGLNVFLTSLIYKKHPAELKFVLIDPKKVELTLFNKIEKHFLAKLPGDDDAIITDTSKVIHTLMALCLEMDNRYNLLKDASCRNIQEYNTKFCQRKLLPNKGHKFLPYIVLVIDELADLMMVAGKEVETPIARLAQLARAVGIHLIVATQRPSVNVITGIIKANFPARLSFKVTSKIDSRTILDAGGAEQLVGMGDFLFSMGSDIIRLQCPFLDTPEVERICDHINEQPSFPSAYELPEIEASNDTNPFGTDDSGERDALFEEAARIIVINQQGSTSLLQRRLKLGYNRAGRIIDQLERAGIVGAFEGSKAREVLVPDEYALERLLSTLH